MKVETNNWQQSYNLAFTLVEISIVIVIISILVAGVFSGQKLVQNSKVQNAIKELREYDAAILSFKDKFRYYPGDLPTAATYWGAYSAGPPITGATNGDANWQVSSTEALQAFRQLGLAGFIKGTYSGATSTPNYVIGLNLPGSKYDKLTSFFFAYHASNFQTTGNALTIAKIDGTAAWDSAMFPVQSAFYVDQKIDDGNAGTGNLYAIDGGDVTAGSCSAKSNGAPANYNLASTIVACRLFWWLDKDN